MKSLFVILASVFALNAFAADTSVTPAPTKVEKKAEVKPTKSQAKTTAKSEPAKTTTTK
jgi:hypothetical protein